MGALDKLNERLNKLNARLSGESKGVEPKKETKAEPATKKLETDLGFLERVSDLERENDTRKAELAKLVTSVPTKGELNSLKQDLASFKKEEAQVIESLVAAIEKIEATIMAK